MAFKNFGNITLHKLVNQIKMGKNKDQGEKKAQDVKPVAEQGNVKPAVDNAQKAKGGKGDKKK